MTLKPLLDLSIVRMTLTWGMMDAATLWPSKGLGRRVDISWPQHRPKRVEISWPPNLPKRVDISWPPRSPTHRKMDLYGSRKSHRGAWHDWGSGYVVPSSLGRHNSVASFIKAQIQSLGGDQCRVCHDMSYFYSSGLAPIDHTQELYLYKVLDHT